MADSQLQCMEDGQIGQNVPEGAPEFYYSEVHRRALEELLKDGDSAFKTLLREDKAKDFLSALEISAIYSSFEKYGTDEDSETSRKHADHSKSLRSTYWPELSDTELPLLDIGWQNINHFIAMTRVQVYTHPPKDNGPHIKEVVRRLIQEARKVVAIVMDLLTDLQILQDLLDVALKRSVAVYIILDGQGVPHFLDMCNRLEVTPKHLQNIRTRMLRGIGIDLSIGRIPGRLTEKYMIIDGDKVMFGSYSFSWSSSRMDRNMITIMSGPTVEIFDRDFRELYAMSRELNLFKEFSISQRYPAPSVRATVIARPTQPATSRFQVSLGDKGTLKVPAHKYHNPKYLLALGGFPDENSTQHLIDKMKESIKQFPAQDEPMEEDNKMHEQELQARPASVHSKQCTDLSCVPSKKKRFSFRRKSKVKKADKTEEAGEGDPGTSTTTNLTPPTQTIEDIIQSPEEPDAETNLPKAAKKKKSKKMKDKDVSPQSEDQGSESRKQRKKACAIS